MESISPSGGASGTLIKVLSFTAAKTLEIANSNSVVGEKICSGDITVIPISKLSVGFAGGGADISDAAKKQKRNPAGAGAKVTLTPMTFLVIKGGEVNLMNIAVDRKPTTAEAIISSVIAEAEKLIAARKEKKAEEKANK